MACSFEIQGRPTPKGDYFNTDFIAVTPDYFRTMRIPSLGGRGFTARDELTSPPVAIVNETLARRFFPNDQPLGKRIRPAISNGYKEGPLREIVGVVGDVKARGLTQPLEPQVYVPQAQSPMVMTVVVRTMMDPRGVIDAVRRQVAALDRELPLYNVMTLDQYLAIGAVEPRFNTLLIGLFAGLAVVLAAVGLYGVISYSAVQRSHEIGVRMALGAQRLDVLRLVIGQGLTLALAGVAIGLVGALALTQVLSSLLYGVRPTDPTTLIVVALVLSGVAIAASYIPARRATKVDPMVALRYE
jgi:putative ABC transport system permease protein